MSKLIDKRFLFLLAVVQSLIRVWLSVTPWTEAHQTNSVLHHLLEFAQTHGHWISGAIQPSHPLLPLSPALNLSQHQYLYQWVSSWHQVAKVLELSFLISPSNEYSGLISFRIDLLSVQCIIPACSYFSAYLLHISLSYYLESSSCSGKVRIWQQDTIFTLKEFSILNVDSAQNFLREWIPSKGATERTSLSGLETVWPVA